MCHIVTLPSLILTLSLSPMEVIRRAMFTFDQSVGGCYDLPCLMSNSLYGSLEMTGIGLGYTASTVGVSCTTRVKTMMNNRATMVSLKFWVVEYGQSYWFSVDCKDCSGISGILFWRHIAECCKVLHTCSKVTQDNWLRMIKRFVPWIHSSQVFQFTPSPPAFSTTPHLLLRSQLEEYQECTPVLTVTFLTLKEEGVKTNAKSLFI